MFSQFGYCKESPETEVLSIKKSPVTFTGYGGIHFHRKSKKTTLLPLHKNAYFLHEKLFGKSLGKCWWNGEILLSLYAFPTRFRAWF